MGLGVVAETKRMEAAGGREGQEGQEGNEISDPCHAGRFIKK